MCSRRVLPTILISFSQGAQSLPHLRSLDQGRRWALRQRRKTLRAVGLPPAQVGLPPEHRLQNPEHGRARARRALDRVTSLGEGLLDQEVDHGPLSVVGVLQNGVHDDLAEVNVERDEGDELARERERAAKACKVLHLVAQEFDGGQVLQSTFEGSAWLCRIDEVDNF
jgi:hypothetical protein